MHSPLPLPPNLSDSSVIVDMISFASLFGSTMGPGNGIRHDANAGTACACKITYHHFLCRPKLPRNLHGTRTPTMGTHCVGSCFGPRLVIPSVCLVNTLPSSDTVEPNLKQRLIGLRLLIGASHRCCRDPICLGPFSPRHSPMDHIGDHVVVGDDIPSGTIRIIQAPSPEHMGIPSLVPDPGKIGITIPDRRCL